MKKLVFMFFIIAMPAVASEQENSFLEKITSAGRNHDLAQWQSLHCEAHVVSSVEVQAIKYFTAASLSPPVHTRDSGAQYELSFCFESPTAKEMCMVVPVLQHEGTLCLGALPNKALKKESRYYRASLRFAGWAHK